MTFLFRIIRIISTRSRYSALPPITTQCDLPLLLCTTSPTSQHYLPPLLCTASHHYSVLPPPGTLHYLPMLRNTTATTQKLLQLLLPARAKHPRGKAPGRRMTSRQSTFLQVSIQRSSVGAQQSSQRLFPDKPLLFHRLHFKRTRELDLKRRPSPSSIYTKSH